MSDAVLVALITSLITAFPPTLLGILTLLMTLRANRKIEVVKQQNDGVISRLETAAEASRQEAKTATADAAVARAETVTATAAGVAGVIEANRTHEASSAAIKEGAIEAIEPIAEKAVAQGAKEAIEATTPNTNKV